MALFNQSSKTVNEANQEIADSAAVSADSEMLTRAQRSLNAAIQHFNTKAEWAFLLGEADPVSIVPPFAVTGLTASAGQTSANVVGLQGVELDDFIVGSGFAPGTRVSSTANASAIGFNAAITGFSAGTATSTVTANRDMYDLPADFKKIYVSRFLKGLYVLRKANRRLYDRLTPDEETTSAPLWYDTTMIGSKGKLRILKPPAKADTLLYRYHRKMARATASAQVLDIYEDYENYLIAWAKWHFLTDKGDGRAQQANTWLAFANQGLSDMKADQTREPDEDLGWTPGHVMWKNYGDNSVNFTPYEYE